MSTYVLVHGAWHGEWCWEKIIPLLKQEGHRVITFDLSGHGKDPTPPSEVTLKVYTDRLCHVLDKEPEPVILAGHSMGGMIITQTAEYRPEKIKLLVYIAAFLPENGQSLAQLKKLEHEQNKDLPEPIIIMSEDGTSLKLKESGITHAFYGECSKTDVSKAKKRLCAQPLAPLITPVRITDHRFGKIPRVYIETLRDKAISIQCQREMVAKSPCQKVLTMDTDHSPFFSQPEALVSHLINADL
jgi:pimeloyl-ACP methyl ester carboxylesterase